VSKNSKSKGSKQADKKERFISKFVGRIFQESLPRARKESQIAQQASAGDPLSMNPLLVIRKAQRGRNK
jgi:hypothetical protein